MLKYGETPQVDRRTWTFRCFGLVEQDVSWTWEQFVIPLKDLGQEDGLAPKPLPSETESPSLAP